MARSERTLTARGVAALTELGLHSDGGGLYLRIGAAGRRSWVWKHQWHGKTREMGLGSADMVGLKEARDERDKWRAVLQQGKDPIIARKAALGQADGVPTFGSVAEIFLASKQGEWKNAKHKDQWRNTLEQHAAKLWNKPVDQVDTAAVLAVLKPVWSKIPETASRLRGRIEKVLDAARALGHIEETRANPARWKGHLANLLSKRQHLTRGHHAALSYAEMPKFIAKLQERPGVSCRALEFTILTAARSGETLGATWAEIDLENQVWTVPPARMKSGRPHRVPLSPSAMAILWEMQMLAANDYVFPGARMDKPLSGMALEMALRRMGMDEITPHGFRSSFRDWAGDCTTSQREVVEAALAHVVGDKAEQAYRRSDALEKRRELMETWSRFCDGGGAETVVPLRPVK